MPALTNDQIADIVSGVLVRFFSTTPGAVSLALMALFLGYQFATFVLGTKTERTLDAEVAKLHDALVTVMHDLLRHVLGSNRRTRL